MLYFAHENVFIKVFSAYDLYTGVNCTCFNPYKVKPLHQLYISFSKCQLDTTVQRHIDINPEPALQSFIKVLRDSDSASLFL